MTVVGPRRGPRRAPRPRLTARPLHGRSVAVTRARAQASGLAGRLRELGAEVLGAAAIRVCSADPARRRTWGALRPGVPDQPPTAYGCCSSASPPPAATRARWPGATVAAIGPGIRRSRCASAACSPTSCPEGRGRGAWSRRSRGIQDRGGAHRRSAAGARDVLPRSLRERGAEVHVLELYETVAEVFAPQLRARGTAQRRLRGPSPPPPRCASCGARRLGGGGSRGRGSSRSVRSPAPRWPSTGSRPHGEAEKDHVDGLVDALLADAARR